MTRALSLTCVCLLSIGVGGSIAVAGNKPTVAILGVEVLGDQVTGADTQVAKELTEGLRSRAKAGTGPYQLAPGSDKELIDEKLLKNCDSEAAPCMSAIGGDLGADWLIYGKIEKQGSAYRVDLKLLNVSKKALVTTWPDVIPLSQASGAQLQGWAKKGYSKLTGQNNVGTVVVKVTNADRGTVLIDGNEKGNIVNNKASIDLPPGKYKLSVDSQGFKRWEKEITVTEDQQTPVSADLEKIVDVAPPPPPPPICDPAKSTCENTVSHTDHRGMWKGIFYGSVAVAAIGGGVWIAGYLKINSTENTLCLGGAPPPGVSCTPSGPALTQAQIDDLNNVQGPKYEKWTKYGGITLAVAGGVALFALYKGFVAKDSESTEHASSANGHRVRRQQFSVTPILSPQGGGATLQFDW
jgi:hypothetical protein